MQIIMILILLGAVIGLIVNTGRKLFLWFRPLFAGASPLVFGAIYGMIMTAVLVFFCTQPHTGQPHTQSVFSCGSLRFGSGCLCGDICQFCRLYFIPA